MYQELYPVEQKSKQTKALFLSQLLAAPEGGHLYTSDSEAHRRLLVSLLGFLKSHHQLIVTVQLLLQAFYLKNPHFQPLNDSFRAEMRFLQVLRLQRGNRVLFH